MHEHGPQDDAQAPAGGSGARAVEVMLAVLDFPMTAAGVRARAGLWRVPMPWSADAVPLADLLALVPPDRRFSSASEVARVIPDSAP